MTETVALHTQPYGDSAVLVTARHGEPEQRWQAVHNLAAALDTQPPDTQVFDSIAAYDTLLIEFTPSPAAHDTVADWVNTVHNLQSSARRGRLFHVPTVFGGEYGPDLDDVAAELGLTPTALVEFVTSPPWTVRVMGAPVGAPMLDGATFPSPVRRCREPRTNVPSGSVALAGQQAVVYPVTTPGGWRLIGQTPLSFFTLQSDTPTPHQPGDVIQFHRIAPTEWGKHAGHNSGGTDG